MWYLYRKRPKSWNLAALALQQISCLRSRLVLVQWSLAPDKKICAAALPNSNFLTVSGIILFLGLWGCSPSSLEDYRREGEAHSRKVIQHLETIQTREELLRAEPLLKKDFEAYATLALQAKEYQQKHCDELVSDLAADDLVSEQLKEHLRRIYAIEGGREIVERAQQEALVRLDAQLRSRYTATTQKE